MRQRKQLEVYYDEWCPLCAAIRRRLERWDWLHALRFRSIRDGQTVSEMMSRGISPDALEARMHVRCAGSGKIDSGIAAVLRLCSRVPLLMILCPAIWATIKLGFGERMYDWIAARRMIVPAGGCLEDGCNLDRRTSS